MTKGICHNAVKRIFIIGLYKRIESHFFLPYFVNVRDLKGSIPCGDSQL